VPPAFSGGFLRFPFIRIFSMQFGCMRPSGSQVSVANGRLPVSASDNRGPITDNLIKAVPVFEARSLPTPTRFPPRLARTFSVARPAPPIQPFSFSASSTRAFTLIEMIVVMLIIATLAALVTTAGSSMFDRARKAQAKNDLTQLVTAINAFYTEYGQYPVAAQSAADSADYVGANDANGAAVIDILRVPTPSSPPALNPRGIVFLNVLTAKSSTKPVSGVGTTIHALYDPWGSAYRFKIDNNYNSTLSNPYSANAGTTSLTISCIGWSLGKDLAGGSGDKNATMARDDVISWQ
jgi:prepilin-type N-terminal cleavage/methylation domain-containing protein